MRLPMRLPSEYETTYKDLAYELFIPQHDKKPALFIQINGY